MYLDYLNLFLCYGKPDILTEQEMTNNEVKIRDDLVESAILFLQDSSVANAPLEKKIEFLKSKDLNEHELEYVLDQSNRERTKSHSDPISQRKRNTDEYMYEALPPPLPTRDWRDYFIMATATAGLIFGAYEITKRYIVPNIMPVSKTNLEQDKKEIEVQLEKVDKLLNAIEQEQSSFRSKEEEKLAQLGGTIIQLQETLDQTSRTREKLENEFGRVKLEMATLQNTVDKFISNNNTKRDMENVLKEIESLKSLMVVSGASFGEISNDNKSTKSKSPISQVPGADSIPSASEVLAKLNLGKPEETNNIPEWLKNKQNVSSSDMASIPEWQKSSLDEVDIPNWQTTVQDPANESREAPKE